jgi:hypothetical protein
MDFECKPRQRMCACKSESFAAGTCEVPGFSECARHLQGSASPSNFWSYPQQMQQHLMTMVMQPFFLLGLRLRLTTAGCCGNSCSCPLSSWLCLPAPAAQAWLLCLWSSHSSSVGPGVQAMSVQRALRGVELGPQELRDLPGWIFN